MLHGEREQAAGLPPLQHIALLEEGEHRGDGALLVHRIGAGGVVLRERAEAGEGDAPQRQ